MVRQQGYDNIIKLKTVVLERDVQGEGMHRTHAGFLDYAHQAVFSLQER